MTDTARQPRDGSPAAAGALTHIELLQGEATTVLRTLPPMSFTACISDPGHGIGLGTWDIPPSVELLSEIRRVLVPGATLALIADDRTSHHLIVNVEQAGFRFLGLDAWVYAARRARRRAEPRVAFSPIIIARVPGRPLVTSLDEARIPWRDERDREQARRANTLHSARRRVYADGLDRTNVYEPSPLGRYPTNVIATDPLPGHLSHIFQVPQLRDPEGHPAGKPPELMAQLIRLYSPPGSVILDPFCGGAATGIAAGATRRGALLVERDPQFFALAQHNLAAAKAGNYRGVRMSPHPEDLSASDRTLENMRNNEELHNVEERARVDEPCTMATSRQMAAELHVSVRTLRRRVRNCGWPCIRLGNKTVRFDRKAVLAAAAAEGERANGTLFRQEEQLLGGAGSEDTSVRQAHSQMPTREGHGERCTDGRKDHVREARRRGEPPVPRSRPRTEDARGSGNARNQPGDDDEIARLHAAANAARVFDRPMGGTHDGRARGNHS